MHEHKQGPKRSFLFSHAEDKHCAIFNVVVLLCYGSAFWLYLHPEVAGLESTWDRVAFVLGAGFLLGWISGVNVGVNFHNHAHRPIFRSDWLNRWFERVWTFSGGWPAFYWRHAHVTVHHACLLGEEDWTMPRRRPDDRFENIFRYTACHWPWRFIPHLLRDFRAARGGEHVPRRAVQEGLIFLALWSVPFVIDPLMGCVLWVFPQWLGNAMIMGSGMYVQHAHCRPASPEHPYQHSNSFTSRFFNLTMFNIGYHVVHHDYDQVHWSVLPAFHRRMKKRLVEQGVHVVPYGYFRASNICARMGRTDEGFERFASDQAEGYGPVTRFELSPLASPGTSPGTPDAATGHRHQDPVRPERSTSR